MASFEGPPLAERTFHLCSSGINTQSAPPASKPVLRIVLPSGVRISTGQEMSVRSAFFTGSLPFS